MKKAFTMIELIFVIVIIGILATIAIPKLNSTTNEAKKSILLSFVDTLNKTVGPSMYARALTEGEVGITSSGADLCKSTEISKFIEVPTGLSITADCVVTVGTSGIPAPTSGLEFSDSTAIKAPSWTMPDW
jgi:prepilin-type N-terminal cleavage/methylation domain-containing protein